MREVEGHMMLAQALFQLDELISSVVSTEVNSISGIDAVKVLLDGIESLFNQIVGTISADPLKKTQSGVLLKFASELSELKNRVLDLQLIDDFQTNFVAYQSKLEELLSVINPPQPSERTEVEKEALIRQKQQIWLSSPAATSSVSSDSEKTEAEEDVPEGIDLLRAELAFLRAQAPAEDQIPKALVDDKYCRIKLAVAWLDELLRSVGNMNPVVFEFKDINAINELFEAFAGELPKAEFATYRDALPKQCDVLAAARTEQSINYEPVKNCILKLESCLREHVDIRVKTITAQLLPSLRSCFNKLRSKLNDVYFPEFEDFDSYYADINTALNIQSLPETLNIQGIDLLTEHYEFIGVKWNTHIAQMKEELSDIHMTDTRDAREESFKAYQVGLELIGHLRRRLNEFEEALLREERQASLAQGSNQGGSNFYSMDTLLSPDMRDLLGDSGFDKSGPAAPAATAPEGTDEADSTVPAEPQPTWKDKWVNSGFNKFLRTITGFVFGAVYGPFTTAIATVHGIRNCLFRVMPGWVMKPDSDYTKLLRAPVGILISLIAIPVVLIGSILTAVIYGAVRGGVIGFKKDWANALNPRSHLSLQLRSVFIHLLSLDSNQRSKRTWLEKQFEFINRLYTDIDPQNVSDEQVPWQHKLLGAHAIGSVVWFSLVLTGVLQPFFGITAVSNVVASVWAAVGLGAVGTLGAAVATAGIVFLTVAVVVAISTVVKAGYDKWCRGSNIEQPVVSEPEQPARVVPAVAPVLVNMIEISTKLEDFKSQMFWRGGAQLGEFILTGPYAPTADSYTQFFVDAEQGRKFTRGEEGFDQALLEDLQTKAAAEVSA